MQKVNDPAVRHTSSGALIRRFLPYLAKYKKTLFIDLFCAAMTTLCDIILPKIMSTITNSAMGVGITLTAGIVLKLAAVYFVLRIIDGAAQYFMSGIGHIMGVHIETDMRRDAFDHLLKLDHTYYNNTKVGTIMGRITNDLFDVTEFAHHCPEEFFIAGIKILASFLILCQASVPLTLAVFACVPLMGVVSVKLNQRLRARFRQQRVQIGELNATIEDSLLGQGVVKAFAAEDEERVLVVASAGNTARAFAKVCSDNHIKLLLSVPYDNIEALWFEHPLNPCVKLISCEKGGDYFDAIHLSDIALKGPGFYAEGGAKNVARRDGMACTVLSAVTTIGRIPDYYFQAVGSGTGAIAAWEANMRLIEDGRFGSNTMKLMVSQNAPFVPMYDAWQADSRKMLPYEDDKARRDAEIINAKVLSNRKPPYGIRGGLYDALKATGGDVLMATNLQAQKAAKLFLETEGIDIYSAPAIALASLIKEVNAGHIDPKATIMLNITGGGEARFKKGKTVWHLQPSVVFPLTANAEEVVAKTEALFE